MKKKRLLASVIVAAMLFGATPAYALGDVLQNVESLPLTDLFPAEKTEQTPETISVEELVSDEKTEAHQPVQKATVPETNGTVETLGADSTTRTGTGLTADDPMIVPDEGYAFKDGTIYGISASWFRTTFLEKDMESVYFSIELPTTINNQDCY